MEQHAEDRYRFHDLLRQHAHRHAVGDEDSDTRHRVVVTILAISHSKPATTQKLDGAWPLLTKSL